jgi:hypothetical protein
MSQADAVPLLRVEWVRASDRDRSTIISLFAS